MEMIVCLETPIARARSSCVIPELFRRSLMSLTTLSSMKLRLVARDPRK
jgi:hypothetical protein